MAESERIDWSRKSVESLEALARSCRWIYLADALKDDLTRAEQTRAEVQTLRRCPQCGEMKHLLYCLPPGPCDECKAEEDASSAPGAAEPPAPERECPLHERIGNVTYYGGKQVGIWIAPETLREWASDAKALAAERDALQRKDTAWQERFDAVCKERDEFWDERDKLRDRVAELETALAAAEKRAEEAEAKLRGCFRLPDRYEHQSDGYADALRRIAEEAFRHGTSGTNIIHEVACAIERGAEGGEASLANST